MPEPSATLVSALRRTAAFDGETRGVRYYDTAESSQLRSYAELDRNARRIGAALQAEGFGPGDTTLIALPQGLPWVDALYGATYAGMTFTPTAVTNSAVPAPVLESVRSTAAAADARLIITDRATADAVSSAADGQRILIVEDLLVAGDEQWWREPQIDGESIAMLTFTSGSTGDPKGVMISHRAIDATVALCREVLHLDHDSVHVGWLPLHHVFGVSTQIFMPAALGTDTVISPTAVFQRRPMSWLEMLSRHKATCTAAGNFAFDLCTRLVTDEVLAHLDLSSVTSFISGSEPVQPATVAAFVERFAPAGVTEEAIMPGFGMSEALFVVGKHAGDVMTVARFDAEALADGRLEPSDDTAGVTFVSCGHAAAGVTVKIVDPESLAVLPDGTVGEFVVSSAAVASGYYKKPEATAATFGIHLAGDDRDYLRTGDLAALVDGELFITGRRKEVIIIRGRNIYPLDLENTAYELVPAIRLAAAFELHGHPSAVGIVAEYDPEVLESSDDRLESIARVLRDGLVSVHSLPSVAVALVPQGALPRTPTGKVQRGPTRNALERGDLVPDFSRGFTTRITVEA